MSDDLQVGPAAPTPMGWTGIAETEPPNVTVTVSEDGVPEWHADAALTVEQAADAMRAAKYAEGDVPDSAKFTKLMPTGGWAPGHGPEDGGITPEQAADLLADYHARQRADVDAVNRHLAESAALPAEQPQAPEVQASAAEQSAAPSPTDLDRATLQLQRAQVEAQAFAHNLLAAETQIRRALADLFPEVKGDADLYALQNTAPARAAQYTQLRNDLAQLQQAQQNYAQRAPQIELAIAAYQHAAFKQWADQEDVKFNETNPEMADPQQSRAAQDQAIDYLHGVGYSDDELKAAWLGQTSLSLRDHRAQNVIRDAARWRESQAKARAARATLPSKRAPTPAPIRAGTAGDYAAPAERDYASAQRALRERGSIDDALAVYRARKVAAR